MVNQFTEGFGKALIFERFRPAVREYFMKAGIVEVPYSLFGKLFWVVLLPVAFIFITKGWPYILSLHQNAFIEFVLAFYRMDCNARHRNCRDSAGGILLC